MHSPNSRQLAAIRCVQETFDFANGMNSHQSCEPTMHCSLLIIHYSHGLLPISIYTKWWQQSIWGHTSYLSDSPTASRLWLCSSLHLAQTEPTWKWRSGTRLAIYNSKEMKKVLVQMFNWAWVQLAWLDFLPWAISCWPLVSSHWTHLPLDKMAAILADDNFKCIFFNENDRILIQISLKYVPRSSIDNKPSLVQSGNGLAPSRRKAIIWTNDG